MMKVSGNGVNGVWKIRQSFGSASQRKIDYSDCLSTVEFCREHWDEPLWVSVL